MTTGTQHRYRVVLSEIADRRVGVINLWRLPTPLLDLFAGSSVARLGFFVVPLLAVYLADARHVDGGQITAAAARGEQPAVRPVVNDGAWGWTAALSQPAVFDRIATVDALHRDRRVLGGTVMQQTGTMGHPGSMPVAEFYLHTDSPAQMLDALGDACGLFDIAWQASSTVAA